MPEPSEAELVVTGVDTHDWGATEDDEEQVLRDLGYVLNPLTGIYEGDGHPDPDAREDGGA
ncbi:hypothetical protein Pth03_46300 [Planotetraspora thailandica]|uniref:Uncharacterized protein n=1 Tax=Planotetraspora thailandica TaxID=487172 RepID=A0A8J3XXQ1_9ACTN|nr:hypothetical protein [Planotetraspora thailandica]GII56241.1 hypothetical protein Pth03_46300 [Planotetraspora thailandica]